jgi:hypothetical protein
MPTHDLDTLLGQMELLNEALTGQAPTAPQQRPDTTSLVLLIPCAQNQATQFTTTSLFVTRASIIVAGKSFAGSTAPAEIDVTTESTSVQGFPLFQCTITTVGNSIAFVPANQLDVQNVDLSSFYAYTTNQNIGLAVYYETQNFVSPALVKGQPVATAPSKQGIWTVEPQAVPSVKTSTPVKVKAKTKGGGQGSVGGRTAH